MQAVREQHHERGADVRVVEEREEVEHGQEGHVEGREGGLCGVVVMLAAVDLGCYSVVLSDLTAAIFMPDPTSNLNCAKVT